MKKRKGKNLSAICHLPSAICHLPSAILSSAILPQKLNWGGGAKKKFMRNFWFVLDSLIPKYNNNFGNWRGYGRWQNGRIAEWHGIFSHHERPSEKEKEKGLIEQKVLLHIFLLLYTIVLFFFSLCCWLFSTVQSSLPSSAMSAIFLLSYWVCSKLIIILKPESSVSNKKLLWFFLLCHSNLRLFFWVWQRWQMNDRKN